MTNDLKQRVDELRKACKDAAGGSNLQEHKYYVQLLLRHALPTIDALLAENEALRKEREWQDISTAPKDGTLILVRGFIEKLATGPCNRQYFEVAYYHRQYNRFIGSNGNEIGHAYLTNWTPLNFPTPPAQTAGRG